MRTQDIKIGEYYRHRTSPDIGYAKALEIIKPKPLYRCHTDVEKNIKHTVVKCEWTTDRDNRSGFIKYFRPFDLVNGKA